MDYYDLDNWMKVQQHCSWDGLCINCYKFAGREGCKLMYHFISTLGQLEVYEVDE